MIKFKHNCDKDLFVYMSPMIIKVAGDMAQYCQEKDLPFLITETISNEERDLARGIHRSSTTHSTGRAFDLAIRKWHGDQIVDFIDWFEIRYQAVSTRQHSGSRKLCVYGDHKHLDHIHVQIHSNYKMSWDKKTTSAIDKILRDN